MTIGISFFFLFWSLWANISVESKLLSFVIKRKRLQSFFSFGLLCENLPSQMSSWIGPITPQKAQHLSFHLLTGPFKTALPHGHVYVAPPIEGHHVTSYTTTYISNVIQISYCDFYILFFKCWLVLCLQQLFKIIVMSTHYFIFILS